MQELASVLEAALLDMADGVIRPGDRMLPFAEVAGQARAETGPVAGQGLNLDEVIRRHVQYALELNRGNRLRAARELGISRSTLYRILGNEAVFSQ